MLKNLLLLFIPIWVIAYATRKQLVRYFGDLLTRAKSTEVSIYDYSLGSKGQMKQHINTYFNESGRVIYIEVDDNLSNDFKRVFYSFDRSGVMLHQEVKDRFSTLTKMLVEQDGKGLHYQVYQDGTLLPELYRVQERGRHIYAQQGNQDAYQEERNRYGQPLHILTPCAEGMQVEEYKYQQKREVSYKLISPHQAHILYQYKYEEVDHKGNWTTRICYREGEPYEWQIRRINY